MINKFKSSGFVSLLDTCLKHNLAESTSEDLVLGELLDDELRRRLGGLSLGYGSSQGNLALRVTIAKRLGVSEKEVLITNGAAAGLVMSIVCLAGEDAEVVTVTPNFPPVIDVIPVVNATRKTVALQFDEGYRLDLNRLSEALSLQTRLVVVPSPHNPSGVATVRKVLKDLSELLDRRAPDAYLLVDEVYREATYGTVPVAESAADLSERVLTVGSMSKCHGAAGLRVGWMTCRDRALLEQFVLWKLNSVISCSAVDETIACYLLEKSDTLMPSRRARLGQRLELVGAWVERNSEYIEWVKPSAGALCCIRLRRGVFSDDAVADFYREAAHHQVQIAPGDWFAEERRVFRLGFGFVAAQALPAALDALEAALRAAAITGGPHTTA